MQNHDIYHKMRLIKIYKEQMQVCLCKTPHY